MNIQNLEFGSLTVNKRDDIPQYAFATDNPDVYFNTEMCREKGHVNGAGSCICRTSCPSSLDDLAAGKLYAVAAILVFLPRCHRPGYTTQSPVRSCALFPDQP